jgi:hypothetical protein
VARRNPNETTFLAFGPYKNKLLFRPEFEKKNPMKSNDMKSDIFPATRTNQPPLRALSGRDPPFPNPSDLFVRFDLETAVLFCIFSYLTKRGFSLRDETLCRREKKILLTRDGSAIRREDEARRSVKK